MAAEGDAVAELVEAWGSPVWSAIWARLKGGRGVFVVGAEGLAALDGSDGVEALPVAESRDGLLLALGRAAGRTQIVVADPAGWRQIFPLDVLRPKMAGLPAVLAASPADIRADVALAAEVRRAYLGAASFDYVAAAEASDRVHRALDGRPPSAAVTRARVALAELAAAGLTERSAEAAASLDGSGYAALLAVHLDRTRWSETSAKILAAVDSSRRAALTRLFDATACRAPVVPPLEGVDDLLFAELVPGLLDRDAAPIQREARPRLELARWLGIYERLVGLAVQNGVSWALLDVLLRERGSVHGLSAAGTPTFQAVSTQAERHLDALSRLLDARPRGATLLGTLGLAFAPGVLEDPALEERVARLAQQAVAARIGAASSPEEEWEAAIAAFAVGTSLPAPLQRAHLEALRQAIAATVARRETGGWHVAGLAAAGAGLGLALGDERAFAEAAAVISRALPLAERLPELARVLGALSLYGRLAADGLLDPHVANPKLFTEERRAARRSLGEALLGLTAEGPATAPEQAFARLLADFADGLLTALVGRSEEGVCPGDRQIGPAAEEAFDRVQKTRRQLFDHEALAQREVSAWMRRAATLAVVLSDYLDVVDRGPSLELRVPPDRARDWVGGGVATWRGEPLAALVGSTYLLVRGMAAGSEPVVILADGSQALRELGRLFGGESQSLFGELAALAASAGGGGALDTALASAADLAFERRHEAHGDLLLMLSLAASVTKDAPTSSLALTVARRRGRKTLLPLLSYGTEARRGGDPQERLEVMKTAVDAACPALDLKPLEGVERALWRFRRGERLEALAELETLLAAAQTDGLDLPRQSLRFRQVQGGKILSVGQSLSFGASLLANASDFELSLGLQTRHEPGTRFDVQLEASRGDDGARYFAHAAGLAASYAFAAKRQEAGLEHATSALGTWVHGVRLGDQRFVPRRSGWSRDATATLTMLGEQTASSRMPFLTGDLWTVAVGGLSAGTTDGDTTRVLDPLPPHLRGVPELQARQHAAREHFHLLTRKLPCTKKTPDIADLQRVTCDAYPTALALRIADALPFLPRLTRTPGSSHPDCAAWRAVDRYLGAADEGRYDPLRFLEAIRELRRAGHAYAPAVLLTRHRHGPHCTPEIVNVARELAALRPLGIHLRADLHGIAANCSPPEEAADDVVALSQLVARHADPTRSYEALLFAATLAARHDQWQALRRIVSARGYLASWLELDATLAARALLVEHAVAAATDAAPSTTAADYNRLLCTTPDAGPRAAACRDIARLRASPTKELAAATLEALVAQATSP
ncbi:MAG: hypothetical protein KC731_22730 [Myxococcales bacterium]|nr:hypothetical protein [Myxococcales bacterium]